MSAYALSAAFTSACGCAWKAFKICDIFHHDFFWCQSGNFSTFHSVNHTIAFIVLLIRVKFTNLVVLMVRSVVLLKLQAALVQMR